MSIFLVLLFVIVAIASWVMAFGSQSLARRVKAIDVPEKSERKIHKRPVPLFGGLGIGVVIFFAMCLGFLVHWFPSSEIRPVQLLGFLIALILLLVVGALDDKYDLSPSVRFPLYVLACFIVVFTGTSITHVSRFGASGSLSLIWNTFVYDVGAFRLSFLFPADVLSLLWLLAVTFATKFLDGLDGLVAGQTVIGAGLIVALTLSPAYFQPPVAILAVIVAAAFFGFLPRNINPAKQFLGESGSVIAGFSLGFLAMVSGAKLAVTLMALGLPLMDAGIVMTGRAWRGVPLWQGDRTHLHFRMLQAGFSQRQAIIVLWLIALFFGVVALGLQTRGKVMLLAVLAGVAVVLSLVLTLVGNRKR